MRNTTIANRIQYRHTLRKSSELSIKDFYCVFVRTEIHLIAFSGPRNCVNTQYAALSGAMSLLLNDTLFCKRPVLIYLHARELFMFLFSSADFLQNKDFKK